jgi:hypothetical protein
LVAYSSSPPTSPQPLMMASPPVTNSVTPNVDP